MSVDDGLRVRGGMEVATWAVLWAVLTVVLGLFLQVILDGKDCYLLMSSVVVVKVVMYFNM